MSMKPITFILLLLTLLLPTTAAVIARAKSLVGKPYDEAFLPDNDAYYCSDLLRWSSAAFSRRNR